MYVSNILYNTQIDTHSINFEGMVGLEVYNESTEAYVTTDYAKIINLRPTTT
jgi:hypothetical protein